MNEQPVIIPRGERLSASPTSAPAARRGSSSSPAGPARVLARSASSGTAADAFAARGYTTARLDFRGRGDSAGDPQQATLDGMIDDACAVADWLRATHGVQRFTLCRLMLRRQCRAGGRLAARRCGAYRLLVAAPLHGA